MDKLITFAVPCYNSAAYMEHCVDTLLQGGDDIEIILVDDGSTKDDTPAICDRYAEQYPDIVRAIHQPNGGPRGGGQPGPPQRPGGSTTRWWTPTTGWMCPPSARPWTSCASLSGTARRWTCSSATTCMSMWRTTPSGCDALPERIPPEPGVRLGADRAVPPLPVPAHALGDLPHPAFKGLRPGAAQAHLLCGQHLRLPAPALGEEYVLPGCGPVPLLHRPGGPERQREGDGHPGGPAAAGSPTR